MQNYVNSILTFRFSSTETSADDTKPPFEDEDIDFAGSDIELQLEEIVEKESGSKAAASRSSSCRVNREMDSRHKTLPGGSENPSKKASFQVSSQFRVFPKWDWSIFINFKILCFD